MATSKNTKKTNAELALEAHDKQVKQAKAIENASIGNMMGKTEDIVIAEGTDHEYTLTLQFPGVARAMEIEDIAANRYGGIAYEIFMEEAIKDVIVSPKIKSINSFWNKYKGCGTATIAVLNFLNKGIEGEL